MMSSLSLIRPPAIIGLLNSALSLLIIFGMRPGRISIRSALSFASAFLMFSSASESSTKNLWIAR